ncbi:response regulator [Cryptosporangium phraense]|uniref:Response regulator transcription factor n=1 Tax=Cryptosporangium phraense TaxID=2593070 RepID=A0A545AQH5_9ACTN|nr:response regulator [Cryptosporangium phraense]TQS43587.1 response regulator transcription factor [Cryptosporangium phraense]
MITVAAVDDDPLVLQGLPAWLAPADSGLVVIELAQSVDELLRGRGRDADVVLLDVWLGDGSTVGDNVAAVTEAGPAVVTISTQDHTDLIVESIEAGALSYVHKSPDPTEIRAAVRAAAARHKFMTPALAFALRSDQRPTRPSLSLQETESLRLYASGLRMTDVARRLGVKPSTAKGYLDRVRAKYDDAGRAARTKLDLRERALEDGILRPSTTVLGPRPLRRVTG